MLTVKRVPISRITYPPEKLSAKKVAAAAEMILAAGLLARPLVVQKSGEGQYFLLFGELWHAAALEAKEVSPHDHEMVEAFVVDVQTPDAEVDAIIEQLNW
jgi:hypothetical protein